MHAKQMQALDLIPEIAAEFAARVRPRRPAACVRGYRTEDAETIVVALGSVLGHDRGRRSTSCATRACSIGALGDQVASGRSRSTRSARRWPTRSGWSCSRRRSPSASAGSSARTCASALSGLPTRACYDVVAGLGGRPITKAVAAAAVRRRASRTGSSRLTFLDLNRELVERELERMRSGRRPGPHAENMLRDIGIVAAGSH